MSPLIVFVCFRSSSDGLWRWHARSSRDLVLVNGCRAFATQEECFAEIVQARQTLQIEPGHLQGGAPPFRRQPLYQRSGYRQLPDAGGNLAVTAPTGGGERPTSPSRQ